MKHTFKILLTLTLILIFHISFSQNNNKKKYSKEIKLFFQNAAEHNSLQAFLNYNDTFNLPEYFSSYKEYIDNQRKIKRNENWYYFDPSTADNYNLTISDFDELNINILNDSNRFQIQNKWFDNDKINIIPDSVSKLKKYTTEYMNPIFFRNYTRCFIAKNGRNYMYSYFFKKRKGKWVFDKSYILIEYD
jgi:hypothetical protein